MSHFDFVRERCKWCVTIPSVYLSQGAATGKGESLSGPHGSISGIGTGAYTNVDSFVMDVSQHICRPPVIAKRSKLSKARSLAVDPGRFVIRFLRPSAYVALAIYALLGGMAGDMSTWTAVSFAPQQTWQRAGCAPLRVEECSRLYGNATPMSLWPKGVAVSWSLSQRYATTTQASGGYATVRVV